MRRRTARSDAALSLVEVMVTVAVIGIVAALAIPNLGRVLEGSREGVAANLVETLNKATREFGHSQWDLRTAPAAGSSADELEILRTLQWRDPRAEGELNAAGPFMRNDWNPATSASDGDYRVQWTGSSWRLLEPGEAGAGLKIAFDGSDLGTPHVHDPAFRPAGAP